MGSGIILDCSKYLDQIHEINYEHEYVRCDPGVVQDQLNAALAAKGYRLGPDTSTGNRATVGGMLANNSSGAHSMVYGKMADHILGVNVVLASGETVYFEEISPDTNLTNTTAKAKIETQLTQFIHRICHEYSHEIKARYPQINRRVSGYNLDALAKTPTPNLAHLIAGSEGTLGVIGSMKLRICKMPKYRGAYVLQFDSLQQSLSYLDDILAYHPFALEVIDHHIMQPARQHPIFRHKLPWLMDSTRAILLIELAGDSISHVEYTLKNLAHALRFETICCRATMVTQATELADLWSLRKTGLGLLMARNTNQKAIAFLEDVAVAPKHLPKFMAEFTRYIHEPRQRSRLLWPCRCRLYACQTNARSS